MFWTGIINHRCVQSFSFSCPASFLFRLFSLFKTTLIFLNVSQMTLQQTEEMSVITSVHKGRNLCNGCVPHHSPPTCQQRRRCAYIAEMKLRIYHMYISRLMNKGSLSAAISAALMFFQAAEQAFTSHHETVVNWTTAEHDWSAKISSREWEWAKGLSAAYIPVVPVRSQCACRSINQTNKALRFLSSSFPTAVSWHISLRECFHLLLCSPFRCSRTVPLYFNLWNMERCYRRRWCHPGQPSVRRITTSPRPARGVRSMLICIEAMNSCEMLVLLLSIFLVTPEGRLEWNQCFFSSCSPPTPPRRLPEYNFLYLHRPNEIPARLPWGSLIISVEVTKLGANENHSYSLTLLCGRALVFSTL